MQLQRHNQKRLSPWTILWAIIALCILLALSPVLLFWIWNANQAKVVAQLEAGIRANGEPAIGEEIIQSFPVTKTQEDVTRLWSEGISALQTTENEERSTYLPFLSVIEESKVPKLGEPWPQLSECSDYLRDNQLALDRFHEAARRGGHARFITDYSNGFGPALPAVQSLRLAVRTLRLEFEVKAHQRDVRGAAEAMRALLVVHRAIERDGMLVSHLCRIAFDGVGLSALAEKLTLVDFSEAELREFQALVRASAPEEGLRIALIGERALGNSILRNPELMGDERPFLSPLNGDKAAYLLLMTDYVNAVGRGLPKSLDKCERVLAYYEAKHNTWAGQWTMRHTSNMTPDVCSALFATARDASRLAAIDIGIAVELYRRENGKLPTSLKMLVPKYLASIPTDVFNGKQMTYKVEGDGFSIYSVGKNQIDDGGTFVVGDSGDEGLAFK